MPGYLILLAHKVYSPQENSFYYCAYTPQQRDNIDCLTVNKEVIMKSINEERLVQVFAGNVWQAQLVKGLLDANSIPCAINDKTVGAVISQYAPNIGDVYVVVTEENKEKALKVIKENTIPENTQTGGN